MVTDGVHYSLCTYQLNSTMLWKAADAYEPVNVCHCVCEGPLADTHLLANLVRFLSNTPVTEQGVSTGVSHGVSMPEFHPHLSPHVDTINTSPISTRLVRQFMNLIGHPKWTRPDPPQIMGFRHPRLHPNAPYLFNLVPERDAVEQVFSLFIPINEDFLQKFPALKTFYIYHIINVAFRSNAHMMESWKCP